MTCHIALSNASVAVMFSDSQGSTAVSAFHGWQKQFAGPDFLVAVAGNGLVLDALFAELDERARNGVLGNSAMVGGFIESLLEGRIRAEARSECEFLLVTPPVNGAAIQRYDPRTFFQLGRRQTFASIGSGAEFVFQTINRHHKLGIESSRDTLADLLVAADEYADAANESLTVDNRLLVGMLKDGRTYLIGDRDVFPTYGPEALRQQWDEASGRFQSVIDSVRSINGEIRNAQRRFSSIRTGTLTGVETAAFLLNNQNIKAARQLLDQLLTDYFIWYDQLLGRPNP